MTDEQGLKVTLLGQNGCVRQLIHRLARVPPVLLILWQEPRKILLLGLLEVGVVL